MSGDGVVTATGEVCCGQGGAPRSGAVDHVGGSGHRRRQGGLADTLLLDARMVVVLVVVHFLHNLMKSKVKLSFSRKTGVPPACGRRYHGPPDHLYDWPRVHHLPKPPRGPHSYRNIYSSMRPPEDPRMNTYDSGRPRGSTTYATDHAVP